MKFFTLLLLLLVGCSASGPKFVETTINDAGSFYIYRNYSVVGAAGAPNVFWDGKLIGTLKAGGYLRVEATPGVHSFYLGNKGGANWAPNPVESEITFDRGQNRFFRLNMGEPETVILFSDGPFYAKGRALVFEISRDAALKEISQTNLSM